MYRIGIDVGGTFTDLVAIDDLGATVSAKVPSTPEDPSIGVLDGLTLLAETLGTGRSALLAAAETDRPRHDSGDQHAARAQGRESRIVGDRRPSRRDRD